jgi:nucleoside-diphosphate-sugar epimerase
MSRSALITGASGFIGHRLSRRLLDDGWTVHALLRGDRPKDLPGLIAHPYSGATNEVAQAVASARPDVAFHLASLYLADHQPDQLIDLVASNVLLTAQLAEALSVDGGGRLLNTGTGWQHHHGASYLPVNLYAATKQAAIDLLRYYGDARGLSVLTLKLFDTYGLGDTRRKLVQLLADAALDDEALAMSPGEQTVDMTHVDDVVDAFVVAADRLLAADTPLNEVWFVGGERMTVRELAARVAIGIGRPVQATFGGRSYRPREVMMPVDPAGASLPGWQRRRTIETFLSEVLAARAAPAVSLGEESAR